MRKSRLTRATLPLPPTCCRAFQHEVSAQSDKHIAGDAAAFLIASADNIVAQQQGHADHDTVNDKGPGNEKDHRNDKGHGNDNGNDNDNGKGNGKGKGKG